MPDNQPIPAELPLADPVPDLADPPQATPVDAAAKASPYEEPAPMIDIHDAHDAARSWNEFFIHIATIVLGLLIAVGLEQMVEYIHHRHQAREARESIQREIADNLAIMRSNQQHLVAEQEQLSKDLDLLNSRASDAVVLPHLEYAWYSMRPHDAAWSAAKVDGSLALIPSSQIGNANYFYASHLEIAPTHFAYFTDMDTAVAIVDHATTAGKLTEFDRQQLLSLTESAMGHNRVIFYISSYQILALQSNDLQ